MKRRGTPSQAKNRGAKKKQQTSKNRVSSPRHNKKESGNGTRVNPALTRDDLKVSAYSKRGAGKKTSKVPGGIIYEKAKSRHARGRAALLESGDRDAATPLGKTGKRAGSRRGPNTTADMPSELSGRGTLTRRRPLSRREEAESEQQIVDSFIRAGTNSANEVMRKARERWINSGDTSKEAMRHVA